MMALGADQVIARDGVVLNPHYETMGLYGSEYWTYVLPRRVGLTTANDLTRQWLVDSVLPGPPAASTSGCSTTPDSWPGVVTTSDCSMRSGRHGPPTAAQAADATAPRSSPR